MPGGAASELAACSQSCVRGARYQNQLILIELEGGNLIHGVDFRSLYATVIQLHWWLDAATALGGRYPTLDLLGA